MYSRPQTPGWSRIQAICDFVHGHVYFAYMQAKATRTASQTLAERQGVCRDFANLAIAVCRCMNTCSTRNNKPRFARILIARGRDAADVPVTQTFGQNTLMEFKVWMDELA